MPRILLVDDSATVLRVMGASLMAGGFAVTTAATGTAALERAARERPDVIVLDIHLPDMSGLEVLSRFKASPELKETPVFLLTGQDDLANVEQGMTMGASGFLAKHSTSPKVLMEKLKGVL